MLAGYNGGTSVYNSNKQKNVRALVCSVAPDGTPQNLRLTCTSPSGSVRLGLCAQLVCDPLTRDQPSTFCAYASGFLGIGDSTCSDFPTPNSPLVLYVVAA